MIMSGRIHCMSDDVTIGSYNLFTHVSFDLLFVTLINFFPFDLIFYLFPVSNPKEYNSIHIKFAHSLNVPIHLMPLIDRQTQKDPTSRKTKSLN